MKYRTIREHIAVTLCAVTVLLSGCSGLPFSADTENETVEEMPETGDDTTEAEADPSGEGAGIIDRLRELAEKESDDDSEGPGEYMLYSPSIPYVIYTVDKDGNRLASYDYEEIKESLKNTRYYDNSAGEIFPSVMAVSDGVIYLQDYCSIGTGGESATVVFAVDGDDLGTIEPVWIADEGEFINRAAIYKGELHLTVSKDSVYSELRFPRSTSGFGFDEVSGEYEDFFAALEMNGCIPQQVYEEQCGTGYAELLDTIGKVLVGDDGHYAFLSSDGSLDWLDGFGPDGNLIGYDADHIFYTLADETTANTVVYRYDVETEKTSQITDKAQSSDYLSYENGILYYAVDSNETYGLPDLYVYAYDVSRDESSLLFEKKTTPGSPESYALSDMFRILGGNMYTRIMQDDEYIWAKVDLSGGEVRFDDIGCPIQTMSAFKYGEVKYSSDEELCPYCSIPLEKYYAEYFILDPAYSGFAEKINEDLKNNHEAIIDNYRLDQSELTDEECEYHKESPSIYCVTNDFHVNDVSILSDHYMTVNMSGYWYGGGAHGYPLRNQYLYDLDSGASLGLADIYPGTEEDFKKLAAEKTREDYRKYDYYSSPYFAEDEQAVYDQAYEYAGLTASYVEFTDKGIYLIYPPYDMGSYAAGYIEIFISYEELLGRDSL